MFDPYKMAGVTIAGLLIIWQFWPAIGLAIKNAWPSPQLATPAAALEAVDDDALDFQAVGRLQRRFDRNNCDEGRAAVQTALTCFYKQD